MLGVIGLLIAIWRLLALSATSATVNRQAKNLENPGNNPLGRVLKIAHDNPDSDIESLELKLGEQILKETPKFNTALTFLKIISVVAPLLGLLGTVTGMIHVFDVMAFLGSGNARAMANGVSMATIPTMAGMVVALSGLFFSSHLERRAVLETQQAADSLRGHLG